jgi:hypothetical protein
VFEFHKSVHNIYSLYIWSPGLLNYSWSNGISSRAAPPNQAWVVYKSRPRLPQIRVFDGVGYTRCERRRRPHEAQLVTTATRGSGGDDGHARHDRLWWRWPCEARVAPMAAALARSHHELPTTSPNRLPALFHLAAATSHNCLPVHLHPTAAQQQHHRTHPAHLWRVHRPSHDDKWAADGVPKST